MKKERNPKKTHNLFTYCHYYFLVVRLFIHFPLMIINLCILCIRLNAKKIGKTKPCNIMFMRFLVSTYVLPLINSHYVCKANSLKAASSNHNCYYLWLALFFIVIIFYLFVPILQQRIARKKKQKN